MSGRRIDDHSGFPGKSGGAYPLPEGNKMKRFTSAEGDGHVGKNYPDTTEMIERDQKSDVRMSAKQKMKAGQRY